MKKSILVILVFLMLAGGCNPGSKVKAGNVEDGEQGSKETRLYLPLIVNEWTPPVLACFYYEDNSESCDWLTLSFDTGKEDGNKPAYNTQDEGFYNELWEAKEFTINGNPFHVEYWTTINASYPLDFTGYQDAQAFIYIEMDGNYYVMGIASGWLSGEAWNKWGYIPDK